MKPQDKILLDASSNGSLTKYKTAEEAWQLIADLAESTQHAKQRNNHPRTINEVSSTPQRVCRICACNSHYTDECPQLQENNTLAATNAYFNHSTQGPYQQGAIINKVGKTKVVKTIPTKGREMVQIKEGTTTFNHTTINKTIIPTTKPRLKIPTSTPKTSISSSNHLPFFFFQPSLPG
ncbi:hypothetical protein AHAS_Ahas20G0152200 [Arachis hypogaea]